MWHLTWITWPDGVRCHISTLSGHIRHNLTEIDGGTKMIFYPLNFLVTTLKKIPRAATYSNIHIYKDLVEIVVSQDHTFIIPQFFFFLILKPKRRTPFQMNLLYYNTPWKNIHLVIVNIKTPISTTFLKTQFFRFRSKKPNTRFGACESLRIVHHVVVEASPFPLETAEYFWQISNDVLFVIKGNFIDRKNSLCASTLA